jgi:hypothetical protein
MIFNTFIENAESILTCLAILIGGGWTFWKFVLQREDHPKIQFDIDINYITIQDQKIVFEVLIIIENKGLVRHEIDPEDFTLRIRYITNQDKIQDGLEKYNYQTKFPHLHLVDEHDKNLKRSIVPKSWENTFIDPGVKQKYSYITSLPDNTTGILVKSKFNYSRSKLDFHGAQKAFAINKLNLI